jgi:hypothetical protein
MYIAKYFRLYAIFLLMACSFLIFLFTPNPYPKITNQEQNSAGEHHASFQFAAGRASSF